MVYLVLGTEYLEFGKVYLKFGMVYLILGTVYLVFGIMYLLFDTVYLVFGMVYLVFGMVYLVFGTVYLISWTRVRRRQMEGWHVSLSASRQIHPLLLACSIALGRIVDWLDCIQSIESEGEELLKFQPAGAFNAYESHHNCSRELTQDWVSEEREELENLRAFDILVKQALTKENDRSRGLTKDQSPLCGFFPPPQSGSTSVKCSNIEM